MDIKEKTITTKQQNILSAYERMKNHLDSPSTMIKTYVNNLHEKSHLSEIISIDRWQYATDAMNGHWSKIPTWSCEQATALSLQIDPKLIERIRDKRKRFSNFKGQILTLLPSYQDLFKEFFTPELLDEYLDRYQIFESQFKFIPHTPLKMIEWANHRGIFFLQELSEKVKNYSGDPTDWQKEYEKKCQEMQILTESFAKNTLEYEDFICSLTDLQKQQNKLIEMQKTNLDEIIQTHQKQIFGMQEKINFSSNENRRLNDELQKYQSKQIHTKEKESLLKMVGAMALDGYGYKPNDKKSPIAREIHDKLIEYGLSLDEDTIRKFLKQATELIPSAFAES